MSHESWFIMYQYLQNWRDESQKNHFRELHIDSFILNIISTYQKRNTGFWCFENCKFWEHKGALNPKPLFLLSDFWLRVWSGTVQRRLFVTIWPPDYVLKSLVNILLEERELNVYLYVLLNEINGDCVLRAPWHNHVCILLRWEANLLKSRLDQRCVLKAYTSCPVTVICTIYWSSFTWCRTCSRSRPLSSISLRTLLASLESASVSTKSFMLNRLRKVG